MMANLLSGTLGVEGFPTEFAAWFNTPERMNEFAAGLIEQCWWLTLPTDQRAQKLAAGRIGPVKKDGLRANISTSLYLAWVWHVETAEPVQPTLLVATACALGLASWTEGGKPFPIRSIRALLGLPTYNDLPAFVSAARLSADAALSEAKLGELVSVSRLSIRAWKANFPRFTKASDDLFLPLGLGAVPEDPAVSEEAVPTICGNVAHDLDAQRAVRAKQGQRRRPQTLDIPVEPRVTLLRVALQLVRRRTAVPPEFLTALISTFGMVGTGEEARSLIAPEMISGLGLPADVTELAAFHSAIQIDGEALAAHLAAMLPDADFHELSAEAGRLISEKWLTKLDNPTKGRTSVSANSLATQCRVSRPTIQKWRGRKDYGSRVKEVALRQARTNYIYSRWRAIRVAP